MDLQDWGIRCSCVGPLDERRYLPVYTESPLDCICEMIRREGERYGTNTTGDVSGVNGVGGGNLN